MSDCSSNSNASASSGSCACEGTFNSSELAARQRVVLVKVLIINLLAFGLMVTGAWLSGSSALLSGTLDNLGDAVTYGLSFLVVGAGVAMKARVAMFKGILISLAAVGVMVHIIWRLQHMDVPLAEIMGSFAALNLAANIMCLWLLTPFKDDDVNMSSVYECSRNDIIDGVAVIATAGLVWLFDSGWPDVIVATILLFVFARSASRVLRNAWQDLGHAPA